MAQRYKFESKSQLTPSALKFATSCFQWLKGTNLKANHNGIGKVSGNRKLFPMAQRYKFESKSQQWLLACESEKGCFQWLKGTNLKANHNRIIRPSLSVCAVSNGSKVQIWKQITTLHIHHPLVKLLFPMAQRYKFESKSQHNGVAGGATSCCFQWLKGTNLKANHN